MSDTLPLPEPVLDASEAREIGLEAIDLFDADQMREYAAQAVQAERAKWYDEVQYRYGFAVADEISARSKA